MMVELAVRQWPFDFSTMFWIDTRGPGTGPEMDENPINMAWQAGLGSSTGD